MQGIESSGVATLENQITARYGLLLSQAQLAELLGHRAEDRETKPQTENRAAPRSELAGTRGTQDLARSEQPPGAQGQSDLESGAVHAQPVGIADRLLRRRAPAH